MNFIIVPGKELAISSINASSGRVVGRANANSENEVDTDNFFLMNLSNRIKKDLINTGNADKHHSEWWDLRVKLCWVR